MHFQDHREHVDHMSKSESMDGVVDIEIDIFGVAASRTSLYQYGIESRDGEVTHREEARQTSGCSLCIQFAK